MLQNHKFGHENEMHELLADLGPLRSGLEISRGTVPREITNGRDGDPHVQHVTKPFMGQVDITRGDQQS
jgi:hypothetical protein